MILRLLRRSFAWMAGPCAVGVVAVSYASLRPAHRVDPASLAREADASLRVARMAHAQRWAPMNFAQAEAAYAWALVERRRQQFRPSPLRRFEAAESAFVDARDRADAALRLADRGRESLRRRAARAVDRAFTSLAPLDGIENLVWVGPELRADLGRTRAMATEARALVRDGETVRSQERAWQAEAAAHALTDTLHTLAARYADRDSVAVWKRWATETVAWSASTGRAAIVVYKDEHRLSLYEGGKLVRSYRAEIGWNNLVYKLSQGDGATPEGRYTVVRKKGRGQSRYHRALLLDYPNAADRRALAEAKRQGLVHAAAGAGGLIEIHGAGGRGRDWTDGCVAVTDPEIEHLFSRVAVGTPVTIVGSGDGDGAFSTLARKLAR